MTRSTITFPLPPAALAFAVTSADLEAVQVYDPHHDDGRPWRWPGVSACAPGVYRVRLSEETPWGANELLDLSGRFPTERAAATAVVRYLKWRHGPDDWVPRADRPPVIEAFDDEVDEARPPSWVGRVWLNGTPELVFADADAEAGYATYAEALAAAVAFARGRFADDWRWWLGRCRRPWCESTSAAAVG